jgi:NADH-quinone oxidoreductase subunit H
MLENSPNLVPWVRGIVGILLIAGLFVVGMIAVWIERRLSAAIQLRHGPNRVGKYGLFQLVADAIKLLTKEDVIPKAADRLLFVIAPIIIMGSLFMMLVAIPVGAVYVNGIEHPIVGTEMDISILYIEAMSAVAVIGIFVIGYGQNNKYALMGTFRNFAKMIGYELPLGITIVSVAVLAGSLNIVDVVNAQHPVWFVFLLPLGFVIYFICMLADMGRLPFDQNESEEELQAGVFMEYSGMRFGLAFFAGYFHLILGSFLIALLFLGGWSSPEFVTGNAVLGYILPTVILVVKAAIVLMFIVMLRWALPRYRIDQVVDLSWKKLLPLSLLNLGWAIALGLYLGA